MPEETATPRGAREFLPAMGRHALLPLYDPLTRILGVGAAHRRLVDDADIRAGQHVLEIGCGTGNLLLAVARTRPVASAVGLDPDPAALAVARRKADRRGLAARWERGYADELPFPDSSIDRVLSAFMFHHLPTDQKQAALREVRRVLAPGGSLNLVDIVGHSPQTAGPIARLLHRVHGHGEQDHVGHGTGSSRHGRAHGRLVDNAPDRVRELMSEAGLVDAVEVARSRSLVGRLAYYRARADARLPEDPGVSRG